MSEPKPVIPGYDLGDLIGSGASAQVWQITDADGHTYAAKVFNEPGPEQGAIEWEALRRYRGPHIIEAIDWILCPDERRALITQYASGGNLQEVVEGRGGLTSGECITALGPIAGALAAIHEDGFVHGDLTPRNILFDTRGKPLLADLGASRPIAQDGASEWGSTGFIAPEILEEESPSASMDVYSLGACAWFALVGEAPGAAVIRPHLQDIVPDVAPGLADFINAALAISPGARPSMAQAQEQMAGATRSVVVPLSIAKEPAKESSMTLRLRAEAATKQQHMSSTSPRGHRGEDNVRGRNGRSSSGSSASSHRVGGALLSGAAVAVFACVVPLGGHAKAHPYVAGGAVLPHAETAHDTDVVATTQASPSLREVQALLNCRANLWRDPQKADVTKCMVPGSTAFLAESASLTQAKDSHLRYDGLAFAVKNPMNVLGKGIDAAVITTIISRSAYKVQDGNHTVQVPSRQEKAEVTFSRQKGQWRMTSWKSA